MHNALTIDDFKTYSATCEVRYGNAYLIYDRTGRILENLRDSFTDIQVVTASPPQTTFTSDEGTFVLELGACRFTSPKIEKGGETFAKRCKTFFDTVASELNISVFTRIGLRYIARKDFKDEEAARKAVASLELTSLKPAKRFNSSDGPTEVLFRWEDSQIGAFVRIKAETTSFKLNVPLEARDIVPNTERKTPGVTIDIDYYTMAPVEREQWEAEEWLRQRYRIIKKEADGILRGGAT